MDQTRRPQRRRVRQMLIASVLAVTAVGPSANPARADSIDDKRRQAAAIADQLEQLTEQMDSLGRTTPRPSRNRVN